MFLSSEIKIPHFQKTKFYVVKYTYQANVLCNEIRATQFKPGLKCVKTLIKRNVNSIDCSATFT